MKIAFAAIYDPQDVGRGSGTYYYMTREIERQGHTVHYIGPLEIDVPLETRFFRFIAKRVLNKRYRSYQDPFSGRALGQMVTRAVKELDCDVLITNDYAIAAYTHSNKPIAMYTDAVFPQNYTANRHPWLANLPRFGVRFCQAVTRRGMQRLSLCVYPSKWAAEEARGYHILSDGQIIVIPFGANIADPGKGIAAGRKITGIRAKERIDLLFSGKDWSLKGGDTAIAVAKYLQKLGIQTCLHIVGATPPIEVDRTLVKVHGYLDKGVATDRSQLDQLYKTCDAFLLPSMAEGFGISYMEAAAYGLPSLGYKTTGVTSAVKDGVSGKLLEIAKGPKDFAQVIKSWFESPHLYHKLVRGAREHFEKKGNWSVSVSRLIAEIQQNIEN